MLASNVVFKVLLMLVYFIFVPLDMCWTLVSLILLYLMVISRVNPAALNIAIHLIVSMV